jgi:MFS family permease
VRTVLIALINGVAGAILGFIGGDLATRAHNVSNFEGGRAMGIVFLIAPAGFVGAAIIGVLVASKIPDPGISGYAKAQGVALLIAVVIAMLVFGFSIWRAPRLPTIDGQSLNLAFEVRMPEGRTAPTGDDEFSVLMTSRGSGDDRRNADLVLDSTSLSEGRVVVPATAPLRTTTSQRFLVVNDTGGKHYWFDLPLAAKPGPDDERWTEWWPAPGQSATADVNGNGGFQIRFRVQKTGMP